MRSNGAFAALALAAVLLLAGRPAAAQLVSDNNTALNFMDNRVIGLVVQTIDFKCSLNTTGCAQGFTLTVGDFEQGELIATA